MLLDAMFRDDKMLEELQQLTYYELSELVLLTYSTLIDQLSVLLTVLFGYFVASYLVAKKLSLFQVWAVSLVYSAFCIVAIGGYLSLTVRLWNLVYFRDGDVPVTLFASFLVCVFGWLLSVAFMINARYKTESI
jgi:hypothetical protein